MSAVWPLAHVIWADPPGRRSIVAVLPNQLPRPSAVVSAAHTLAGGCAISTTRSMRSGNAMTASKEVATDRLPHYSNRSIAGDLSGPAGRLPLDRPARRAGRRHRHGLGRGRSPHAVVVPPVPG